MLRAVVLIVVALGALAGQEFPASENGKPDGPQRIGDTLDTDGSTKFLITFKIVLEDGTPLSIAPLIMTQRTVWGGRCAVRNAFLDGTVRLTGSSEQRNRRSCDVKIMLTGYRTYAGSVVDGSLIKFRRMGPNEGTSISLESLNAPDSAQKEYQAAERALTKKKWDVAAGELRQAVALYPRYAMAWSELGRLLTAQGRFDEAAKALQQARTVEPKYIKPIVQLAELASRQGRWEDEMQISEESLTLYPVDFPLAYYYHAEAAYHLNRPEAERLTREAIELDPAGDARESLFLLGVIFEERGDANFARQQFTEYVKLAPHGENAAKAKREIERLKR